MRAHWHRLAHRLAATCVMLLLVVAGIATSACSTTTTGEESPELEVGQIIPTKLAIVHTGAAAGDFTKSEQSLGIASACNLAKDLEEDGYDVLMFDSGDSLCGTNLVDYSDGEAAIGFMNAAGYDALAVGTRELSLGRAILNTRISQSDFAVLSANLASSTQDKLSTLPSKTFKLTDGRLVGVLGFTDPQATSGISARTAKDYALDASSAIAAAQQQVNDLQEEGCSLIICLTRLGTAEGALTATTLASQVTGIDILLNAGAEQSSHQTQTDDAGNETLVVDTAGAFAEASVVVWEGGKLVARSYTAGYEQEDEQVKALVTQTAQEQQIWLQSKVATASKALPLDDVKRKEAGLGDLVADAVLWEGRRVGVKITPDAALVDAASIRAALPSGTITYANALSVCPHTETRLYLMSLTGQQLLETLTQAYASLPNESDDLPQLAGIKLTVTTGGDDPTPKLSIAEVGSGAFAATNTYAVIVTARIANGTGAYSRLAEIEAQELGSSAGKGVANYLARACKGTVPDGYEQPAGRLKIVEEKKPDAAPDAK